MACAPCRSRRAGLGDAWTDYNATGQGPANGRVTSPNGDVVVFDSNGQPDYTIPHATSGKDADVNHDPSSPFYGWTQLQIDQYWAQRGTTGILTDAVRASATVHPGGVNTYDPSIVSASDAALRAGASLDPVVKAAIDTPTYGSDVAARSAASEKANAEELLREANASLADAISDGEIFCDTASQGQLSTVRGMITRQQYVDDFLSVAHGGRPTNADAAAGKLCAGATAYGGGGVLPGGGGGDMAPGGGSDTQSYGGGGSPSYPTAAGAAAGSVLSSPLVLGGLGLVAAYLLTRKHR